MFVGTYTRKLQRGGWVRFPKDWLTLLGDNREVFILPDPNGGKSLSIAVADDFRKELKRTEESSKGTRTRRAFVDSAEKVEIAADRMAACRFQQGFLHMREFKATCVLWVM